MKINYGKQHIDQSDISKVTSALKSDKITQGKFVSIFEKNLKKKFKFKYCLSVSNGTVLIPFNKVFKFIEKFKNVWFY